MAGFGRKGTKTLAIAVLLLSAGTVGFAQSPKTQIVEDAATGTLSGKLTDLNSRPLDGVAVIARNQATGAEAHTTTTKKGSYRFTDLQPGEYTLLAESPQLGRGRVEDIEVDAGHEARVQTAMEFEPLPSSPMLAASPSAEPPKVDEPSSSKQPSANQTHPAQDAHPVKAALPAEPLPSLAQAGPNPQQSSPPQPPVSPPVPTLPADAAVAAIPAPQTSKVAPPAAPKPAGPAQPPAQSAKLPAQQSPQPPPRPAAAAPQHDTLSATGALSAHDLQALPVSGRRWQDFALDNAPTSVTPPGGQGKISVRGAGQAEVSVDGATMALAFGATSGSGQRSSGHGSPGQAIDAPGMALVGAGGRGLAVSEAAIRAVQTAAGSVEAVADRAAGGRINAQTLSGANALHGQGFLFDRQNGWGAQNPYTQWVKQTAPGTPTTVPVFTPEPYTPADRETTWGVGLGSRIRRDKLFWFAALDGYSRNDPGLATVKHPDLFFNLPQKNADAQMEVLSARMGPSNNPLAAGVAAYSSMLQTLAGLLGPAPRTAMQWTGFGRIDGKATERQSFTIEAIGATWNAPGGGLTRASETYGSHSFGTTKASQEWLLGRWEAFLTPNLLAVTQASAGHALQQALPETPSAFEQSLLCPSACVQLPQIVIDNRYGFSIGNPSRFGKGSYPDERLYQVQESVDWIRGKLLVKSGFDMSHNFDATGLLRNQSGTYTYQNAVNFASDVWSLQNGFGELNPLDTQHNCDETGGVWHDSGGNLRGVGNLPCYSYYSQTIGPSDWRLSTNDWAGYATAQWQPTKLVVVSAGLRWQREQLPPPLAALANPGYLLTQKLPALGNNWGPRLSLAVGAGEKHWPVLRLGYGMYFARVQNAAIEAALTQTGSPNGDLNYFMRPTDDLPNYGGGAPPFPDQLIGQPGSAIKPGVVEFAPNFHNPEVHQTVAAVEESLPGHIQVTASAMVSLGRRLPISLDTNIATNLAPATPPQTITYNVCDETSATSGCAFAGVGPIKSRQITVPFYASWPAADCPSGAPLNQAGQCGRLNPNYQQITQIMSRANSTYEAFMVRVERYSHRGLSLHAHYTYAHAMDWNPNESAQVAGNDVLDPAALTDPAAFRLEYGTSNLDVRHSFSALAIYEAPWKLRGRAGRFANGWMLSGIGQFRSGLPYTMRTSGSLAEQFQGATPIVALAPGMNGSGGDNRVYGAGSDGHTYNIGRNTFRYPATWKADLRLSRRFDLGHNREIEALAESFNLFNHQNVTELETTGYTIESGSPTSPFPTLNFLTGLKPNTTAFGQPLNINATSFYPVRQFQLGLRVRF